MAKKKRHQIKPQVPPGWRGIGQKPKMGITPAENQKRQLKEAPKRAHQRSERRRAEETNAAGARAGWGEEGWTGMAWGKENTASSKDWGRSAEWADSTTPEEIPAGRES